MSASIQGLPCKLCGLKKTFSVLTVSRYFSKKVRTEEWKGVVGLEIHAQIRSNSKLFSASPAKFGGATNSQVSFFDAALPGTLPVLNRQCVEAGIRTAVALGSRINHVSKFDRKHYFYADLPAGYQITQQRQPLAIGGEVTYLHFPEGQRNQEPLKRKARLVQIQLEQDSGKSLHDPEEQQSLIDLNRAGIGLMEIVTEPDFTDGRDAAAFVRELQKILQVLGTCDGKMAEGSLRVDANVSVHRPGEPLGTRSEVKNLNSVRAVAKAIDYEIKRQTRQLEAGRLIENETRSFDVETGQTVPMRDKEKLLDYRFMPEPNLPPLHVYRAQSVPAGLSPGDAIILDKIAAEIPELPEAKRERIHVKHGLAMTVVLTLVNEDGLLHYFDYMMSDSTRDAKSVANLLTNEFLGYHNSLSIPVPESPITPSQLCELFDLFYIREISTSTLKKVMAALTEHPGSSPREVVTQNDWYQIKDEDKLNQLCSQVVVDNRDVVKLYKSGKTKVFKKLIGSVQYSVGGRADPVLLDRIMKSVVEQQHCQ